MRNGTKPYSGNMSIFLSKQGGPNLENEKNVLTWDIQFWGRILWERRFFFCSMAQNQSRLPHKSNETKGRETPARFHCTPLWGAYSQGAEKFTWLDAKWSNPASWRQKAAKLRASARSTGGHMGQIESSSLDPLPPLGFKRKNQSTPTEGKSDITSDTFKFLVSVRTLLWGLVSPKILMDVGPLLGRNDWRIQSSAIMILQDSCRSLSSVLTLKDAGFVCHPCKSKSQWCWKDTHLGPFESGEGQGCWKKMCGVHQHSWTGGPREWKGTLWDRTQKAYIRDIVCPVLQCDKPLWGYSVRISTVYTFQFHGNFWNFLWTFYDSECSKSSVLGL